MHILLVTHLSRPHEPGTPRPWYEVTFFAQRGHRVSVVTNQRHYLTDEVRPEARGKLFHTSWENGMEMVAVATPPGRRQSMPRRILNYGAFALMSLLAGLRVRDVDLVYVRTPPLLAPLSGYLLARVKKARLVIFLGDLHPEEAVALGLLRSPLLIKFWETMENFCRRRADLLVTPVPGIKRLLMAKGFPAQMIHVSTNAYDPAEERQEPLPPGAAAALLELKDHFLVMFAGTMGHAHALETLLEAARDLQDSHPQIHFVLVGQGDKVPALHRLAAKWHLANVTFLPPVPRHSINTLLNRAQALTHLVYAGEVHGGYYLPNKIFEYLGAGKPVLYSGTGDIAKIISLAQCGLVVEPQNSKALATAIVFLWKHPQEAQEMGTRGKQYVMEHFDRQTIMTDLTRVLENLQDMR